MRVVRFDRFGGPEVLYVVDEPDPPPPGPGEVLLRIIATAVNLADLALIAGRYGVRPSLPATPGLEAAGIVEAVGPDVMGLTVGQRVILALGAARGQGTWRSHLVAPEAALFSAPERLRDEQAGAAIVSSLTALVLLESLQLGEGSSVLVTAPRSSTGRAFGQLAEVYGLRLFGLARRADFVPTGYEAVAVWPYWQDLGEGAFAAALDCVAGDWTRACLDAIRPGGEVVVYGALAGRRSAFAADELIFGAKRLRGFWLQRWLAAASPDDRTAHYDLALAFLGSGLLDPIVAKTFSLDEVEAACRFATEMGHLGKVVLAP